MYFGVLQKEPKDSFPRDTKKNPRDCMAVILRSGRELDERRGEKMDTEEEKKVEMQPNSRGRRKKLKLTTLQFHSLKDCRKQSYRSSSLDS